MLLSELIKELNIRMEQYGDLPVCAHYESDFAPIEILDVSADFDCGSDEPDYIEIILSEEFV